MQLDERELRKLVEAVLSVLKAQKEAAAGGSDPNSDTRRNLYVLFTAPWDHRFYPFADELKTKKNCRFCGVVSPDLPQQDLERLRTLADWSSIAAWESIRPERLENSVTVLPVASRDTVVKAALCISDTYETKWIRAAMEQGGTVVLPRSGLERFTGREPEKYKRKVLSYYRDLLEMNIELPESFRKYRI
jgi:hypothetical protein